MSAIAVTGKSGSGKSTSYFPNEALEIKGLHPKETVIVNVSKKDIPGKGANKMYPPFLNVEGKTRQDKIDNMVAQMSNKKRQMLTDNPARIITLMNAIDCCCPQIKNIIVDDAQYIQGLMVMKRIQEQNWSKFNDIAEAGFGPIDAARNLKRKDLVVFFLYHPDTNEKTGEEKIKTAGKAVDQYITIDGMFTVNLYTEVEYDGTAQRSNYYFRTNTRGGDSCKSPHGMFESLLIPNDLGYVRDRYLEYYQ